MNNREKGNIGEDKAVEHLLSLGYNVLHRNFRTKKGEIDIVAEDPRGTVVFVEVKSAITMRFGNPLYKVTLSKQRVIINMAKLYMIKHNITDKPRRFDVIAIYQGKIDHIKNAFMVRY